MKFLLTTAFISITITLAQAQWTGQSSSSDLTSNIYRTGSIGLGTTAAPLSLLHLNSTIDARKTLRIYWNSDLTKYLSIWQGTGGGAIDPIGTGLLYLGYDQSTNVVMGLTGAGVISGNVGIGLASPLYKLQVKSSASVDRISIQGSTPSSNVGFMIMNQDGSERWSVAAPYTTNMLQFFKGGYGNVMVLAETGNVGIGTTNPNQKLTVNGTIYGKEVKVDLSVPGPDYVFANNYQLQPLNELKTYIDQNKHLPEVPSAAAMEANGINLGEMNMLLLKKVEELTLYIIEQEKRINKLENKLN